MNEIYANAYQEVIEVLKYTKKEDLIKIPKFKIDIYKKYMNKNNGFKIDKTKSLEEQDISNEAKAILANLYKDYWATDYEKQRIETKENYDLEQIAKEKYSTDDLFKKREIKQESSLNNETSMVVLKKDKWYKKLIDSVKKIFCKKNNKLINGECKQIEMKQNKFTIQEKYKNKGEIFEEELFKKYGECRKKVLHGLRILFITDTHNCLTYTDKYINYLKKIHQEDYDICIILGDITGLDFDAIKAIIPNDRLYGIIGNHDSINSLEMNNIKNINGQVIECKGVKIAGIMGSNRYKNGDYGMMTQEECLELAKKMEYADILVSHDKAYIYDRNDNVHDGLKGITEYIYKNHIPLHIHGHLHEEMEEILKNGTQSIGLYIIKLMEV